MASQEPSIKTEPTKESINQEIMPVANQERSIKTESTNQAVIPELNGKQRMEGREKITSGDYIGHLGQSLSVRELAQKMVELRVSDVLAQTNLSIMAETDSQGKTKLKTMLRTGQEREIKIMPDSASQRALERLSLKVCSPDNNCTIQLKNVGNGDMERIQYEVQLDRHSKIFGIFEKKMHVIVDVDAETGDTKVHKPWWAFIATEPAE